MKKRRILISGGEGNLSTHLQAQNREYELYNPSKKEMNIQKIEDILGHIARLKACINTAGENDDHNQTYKVIMDLLIIFLNFLEGCLV